MATSLPIPAAGRTDFDNAIPTVSHKMIAPFGGVGVERKKLPARDSPVRSQDQVRVRADACARICPVGAIKGVELTMGEEGEARFDFRKFQGYFDEIKKDESRKPVCGMCLYVCPHGRNTPP
jgi:ferredoxin